MHIHYVNNKIGISEKIGMGMWSVVEQDDQETVIGTIRCNRLDFKWYFSLRNGVAISPGVAIQLVQVCNQMTVKHF